MLTKSNRGTGGRRLLGGIVILLGFLLLLDSTDIVTFDGFDVFIAGVLVLYGGYRLVTERARHLFWPTTFVLVGTGWLLVEFDVLTGSEASQFWPLLVVVLGVSIVVGRRRAGWSIETKSNSGSDGETAVSFDDHDLVAIFEDARLDLRDIDVETPIHVDALALFGDVELIVPEEWVVVPETVAVFGGLTDRRRTRPAGEPDLVVSGVSVFGDIDLRD
jgi:hypothetical protein